MPTITVKFHELYKLAPQIPDVEDCYLINITDAYGNGSMKSYEDEQGLWIVPWRARKFDALTSAWRQGDEEDWENQWGWDKEDGSFRIGCNTIPVSHPIELTFQWGEGHPKVDDVEMLSHELSDYYSRYCKWCHKEVGGALSDCPERRLRAMATGVNIELHLKAVQIWHSSNPDAED